MRRYAVLLVSLVLASAGCEAGGPAPPRSSGESGTPQSGIDPGNDRSVAIYSAVIRQLVTKDHTFGQGESPFEHVYVLDGVVPRTGNVNQSFSTEPDRPFADDLKQAIEAELRDLPPIDFVTDRDSVLRGRQGRGGVVNRGVIVSLGPIAPSGNRVEVANNLWCGGLCGQWLTYVVKRQHGRWRVTGTVGPVAIS
jgi:hypothetical protein